MAHNPNPFDFVPFAGKVNTLTKEEFDALEERWSGYLTVELKTLTPLHIVGQQEGNGKRITSSKFYRQDGQPVIPGSSIKGMLRSFVETITSGWLSQVNEEYSKNRNERHIGFRLFDDYPDPLGRQGREPVKPAVPLHFKSAAKTDRLDIASWMFGHVGTATDQSEADAVRGRVLIEDAVIDPRTLENINRLPDIDSAAFMGGGKPSASSWWYFSPSMIRKRDTGKHKVAEFVGQKLRGRKFYYHQKPAACIAWYDQNWAKANETSKGKPPYYTYPVETLQSGKCLDFRIYLKDIPTKLLSLFCICLEPGKIIRHKLGFGKAYGYGSIEFSIKNVMLRPFGNGGWPEPLTDRIKMVKQYTQDPWNVENISTIGLDNIIEKNAVEWLAKILGWKATDNLIFTYPPFNHYKDKKPVFGLPIEFDKAAGIANDVNGLKAEAGKIIKTVNKNSNNKDPFTEFSEKFSAVKLPINLYVYQRKSDVWPQISARKP